MIPELEYEYTVEHFYPGLEQVDMYFRLNELLEEYETDVSRRLETIYSAYTAYTYDDSRGSVYMAADVEWRALKAIEIKERLVKVREKVADKHVVLVNALSVLEDKDRIVLLTYYQTGEKLVSDTALNECQKRLQREIGNELYSIYLEKSDERKEKHKKRLKEIYDL